MSSINSMTFDQASYNVGDTITLTVDYTPDVAGTVPTTFTATTTITDGSGNQTATDNANFVVNVAQPGGDTLTTSDTGNRTWTETSDSGTEATFTTTA